MHDFDLPHGQIAKASSDERWHELIEKMGLMVPDLVEDFMEHLRHHGLYRELLVSDDELRATAREVFKLLIAMLEGGDNSARIRWHAGKLGARRARQGVPIDSLLDAIQIDFTVLWSHFREIAGSDQSDLLVERVDKIYAQVAEYNYRVRDAFYREQARARHDARVAHAHLVERLFGAEELGSEGLLSIAHGLEVEVNAGFGVAVFHPNAAAQTNLLLEGRAVSGELFGHLYRGTYAVFWLRSSADLREVDASADRELLKESPLVDEVHAEPGVYFPWVEGLRGVRSAVRSSPRVFAAAGSPSSLTSIDTLSWAVAGEALAAVLPNALRQQRELVTRMRSENPLVIETVEAYLASGSVKETTRRVYCHRNTVLNRLSQFSDALGLDVTVPRDASMAFVLLRMRSVGEL